MKLETHVPMDACRTADAFPQGQLGVRRQPCGANLGLCAPDSGAKAPVAGSVSKWRLHREPCDRAHEGVSVAHCAIGKHGAHLHTNTSELCFDPEMVCDTYKP